MDNPSPDELIKGLAVRIVYSVHISPEQRKPIMEIAESFADEINNQKILKRRER